MTSCRGRCSMLPRRRIRLGGLLLARQIRAARDRTPDRQRREHDSIAKRACDDGDAPLQNLSINAGHANAPEIVAWFSAAHHRINTADRALTVSISRFQNRRASMLRSSRNGASNPNISENLRYPQPGRLCD